MNKLDAKRKRLTSICNEWDQRLDARLRGRDTLSTLSTYQLYYAYMAANSRLEYFIEQSQFPPELHRAARRMRKLAASASGRGITISTGELTRPSRWALIKLLLRHPSKLTWARVRGRGIIKNLTRFCLLYPLIGIVFITTPSLGAQAEAIDYVGRSLGKTVIVTRHGAFTVYGAPYSGVNYYYPDILQYRSIERRRHDYTNYPTNVRHLPQTCREAHDAYGSEYAKYSLRCRVSWK